MTPEEIVASMHAISKITDAEKTMTLGQLIREIEKAKPDGMVSFGFGRCVPTILRSSRGTYSQLAIGYAVYGSVRVSDFLSHLRGAIGGTFDGYKGGEYVMDADTPVWVDNWGDWTSTAIVSVEVKNGESYSYVTIHTKQID